MNTTEIRKKLSALYKEKNILGDKLLHYECVHKDSCWTKNSLENRGKKALWNRVSFPYFGDDYTGELLCVGLNMHRHGGENAQTELINGAENLPREEYEGGRHEGVKGYLKNGDKKINFNKKGYGGTTLWHRIAVYADIILNGRIISDNGHELSEIYKRIAFIDMVKCSPDADKSRDKPQGDASKPESAMIRTCIKEIFLRELDIIKPKSILFLGTSIMDNLKQEPYNAKSRMRKDHTELFEMKIGDVPVTVFKAMHPTAWLPGITQNKLYEELLELRYRK